MKPTVGILLDAPVWRNVKSRKTGYERIELYDRAAKELGLTLFYLNLHRMSFAQKRATGYVCQDGNYDLVTRSIPPVVHNRTIPSSEKERELLKRLRAISDVFNSQTRFSKYQIHRLLMKSPHIRASLPETKPFSIKTLNSMFKRHPQVFVKPQNGSVGEGIYKVMRIHPNRYNIQDSSRKLTNKSKPSMIRVAVVLAGKRRYLIQQGIPLATYKGRPYDIRVSVQRNGEGNWQVTGMVGKVARKGSHLTNVAQGGKVYPCRTLFDYSGFDFDQMSRKLEKLSLEIARHLGHKIPKLSDIGLDIGVDQHGDPYFIELNGRDQRITFKKAKMLKTWHQTFETPLQYASYLLNKQQKLEVTGKRRPAHHRF